MSMQVYERGRYPKALGSEQIGARQKRVSTGYPSNADLFFTVTLKKIVDTSSSNAWTA